MTAPHTPFQPYAQALLAAGAQKWVDVNVLGVLGRSRQPTLEVRCLPMSLKPARVLGLVDEVEDFLGELAASADR